MHLRLCQYSDHELFSSRARWTLANIVEFLKFYTSPWRHNLKRLLVTSIRMLDPLSVQNPRSLIDAKKKSALATEEREPFKLDTRFDASKSSTTLFDLHTQARSSLGAVIMHSLRNVLRTSERQRHVPCSQRPISPKKSSFHVALNLTLLLETAIMSRVTSSCLSLSIGYRYVRAVHTLRPL